MVERIGEHYRANISNRFIRPALLHIPMEKQAWDLVESFTKVEQYQDQGFHLQELYQQIIASAQFVAVVRRDVAPVIRNRVPASSAQDKVFRDMAVNNFNSNIQLFAGMISELYVHLVELDKNNNAKGRSPLYISIPGLEGIDQLLTGNKG